MVEVPHLGGVDTDGAFLLAVYLNVDLRSVDPLDGSSNINANVNIGTIFSIMERPQKGGDNVKADVLALKDPGYRRLNFCSLILGSAWNDGRAVHRCPDCAPTPAAAT